MDYQQKFFLDDELTTEQIDFFNENGFLHFKHFLNPSQIQELVYNVEELQNEWIKKGITKVKGTPIKLGKDENGDEIVQRFAFASIYNQYLHNLLKDPRILALKALIGEDARIAEDERDGMVVNHFVNNENSNYTKLGWHTDGLRDLFHWKLEPMINIGIYIDDSPVTKGGLKILPGTHKQGLYDMLFRKKYFVDNTPDKDEVAIEGFAGDLTVHHGRIWHRVSRSSVYGAESRRRIIYFPIVSGKYRPKSDDTKTPFYHKFQNLVK